MLSSAILLGWKRKKRALGYRYAETTAAHRSWWQDCEI